MRIALISMLVLSSGAVLALGLFVVAPRLLHPRVAHGSRLALREVALALSVAAILAVTMGPTTNENELQLRPFSEIWPAIASPSVHTTAQVVGNVLVFMPFGAALAARGLRRRTATVAACALSVFIEIVQLRIAGRTTAVDDVILNTLGAIVAAFAWRRFHPLGDHRR